MLNNSHGSMSHQRNLPRRGLEEFVDPSLFEGKKMSSAGRAWKAKELRRKSMLDLQKLWFVLYKERNMLMTMDRLAKMMDGQLHHRERIGKVAQSMARIKTIVRERQLQAKKMAEIEFAQKKAQNIYKWPPEDSELARQVLENNRELAEQLQHEENEVAEKFLTRKDQEKRQQELKSI
jgi:large subunit ribosomal protein L47